MKRRSVTLKYGAVIEHPQVTHTEFMVLKMCFTWSTELDPLESLGLLSWGVGIPPGNPQKTPSQPSGLCFWEREKGFGCSGMEGGDNEQREAVTKFQELGLNFWKPH